MPLRLCSLIAVLIGLLFFGSGAGCASTATTAPSAIPNAPALDTARVARIDVPDQIATSDTLRIRLSGTVGPNGCYALARIDEARVPGRITLTPLVQPPTSGDRPCTMAIVPLDTTYAASPPFESGPLSVTALQKNGTPVTDTVRVAD
ncbi:hypothetical protein [Salinibacter grassmerensis]|uniref:hypothetical protein n=1 Tax=Salinibacter grassmerensis TaxID=3040353 RepID=UPI0021E6FD42|nr:hypothetical protein [Salinibacter grassmerensis]